MATKYILQSGGIRNEPTKKKQFHQEIVRGISKNPKFLLCNFAQAREYWEAKFPTYQQAILEDMPEGVQPSFTLAFPATFEEDCRNADVIYIHGGDDHLITYWFKQFDISRLFQGKVVAGNSAGSDVLCTSYWTCDWRQVMDGLAILPVKLIPHFQSTTYDTDPRGPIDWSRAKAELESYGDTSLTIHTPKEGDFIVVEQ